MRVGAVAVEELHLARLGPHRAELLPGAERAVDHGAVARPPQLRAHEGAALARLDVLELADLEDRPLDFDVVAVLELIRGDGHTNGGLVGSRPEGRSLASLARQPRSESHWPFVPTNGEP